MTSNSFCPEPACLPACLPANHCQLSTKLKFRNPYFCVMDLIKHHLAIDLPVHIGIVDIRISDVTLYSVYVHFAALLGLMRSNQHPLSGYFSRQSDCPVSVYDARGRHWQGPKWISISFLSKGF